MPDKLTDNLSNNSPILANSLSDSEIVKALECCAKELGCTKGCPFLVEKNGKSKCKVATPYGTFEKLLLDLINRLQAENERLKNIDV